MDISYLSDYMIPVIVGLCLCVGYVTKIGIYFSWYRANAS